MEQLTISIDWMEVDFEFNYEPGDPGVHTFSNGDPGYPPSGPEIEIIKAWYQDEKKNDKEFTNVWDAYLEWRDKTYLPAIKKQNEKENIKYRSPEKHLRSKLVSLHWVISCFKRETWELIEQHTQLKYQEFLDIVDVLIIDDVDYDSVATELTEKYEEEDDDGPDPDFDDGDDGYRDSETEAMEWGGCDLP